MKSRMAADDVAQLQIRTMNLMFFILCGSDGVENPAPVGTTIKKDYRPIADPKPEKLTPIQINIPPALNQQLARACFEQGCTKTYLIIKALAGEGFEVDPAYLSPDRRKPKA